MAWWISSGFSNTALHCTAFGLHFTDLEKVHPQKVEGKKTVKTLTLKEIVNIPGVKTMCCLFFTTCAIDTLVEAGGAHSL